MAAEQRSGWTWRMMDAVLHLGTCCTMPNMSALDSRLAVIVSKGTHLMLPYLT